MMISQASAMAIVTEISVIIKQHVNLMDDKAIIIASTDGKRVGQFHEGAWMILTEKLDELLIENDLQYRGSKKGLNLPLVFQGRIIGVLGVTGNYDEILKYSQIIRKMTELMLADNYLQKQKHIDELLQKEFYEDWIFSEVGEASMAADPEAMERRAKRFGIDLTTKHRVIVVDCPEAIQSSELPAAQHAMEEIERGLAEIMRQVMGGALAKNALKYVLVVPDGEKHSKLADVIEQVLQMGRQVGVPLLLGVDGAPAKAGALAKAAPSHFPSVHKGWVQATKALQGCRPGVQVSWYEHLGIEIILDDIPQRSREAFVARIFNRCTEAERKTWLKILTLYYENNGAIGATADALFIHKNTMQNRVNQFADLTGYDPRNLKDSALIYLAILLAEAGK